MTTTHDRPQPQPEAGLLLLDDYRHNKETAFTDEEREAYGLTGLLPATVETIERQVERVLLQLSAKPNALEQYIYLNDLAERDQTLFYRTVMADPARFLPILYDPTVADACLTFGHIYRRHAGMYITRHMKGHIDEFMRLWK
jgi:malate dehydrogenase (oxaloacetate-decarboxylating)(NADP+)